MLETGVWSSGLLTQREKVCRGRWALGKPLLQASGVQEDVRGTAGVVAGGPAAQGTRTSLPTAPSPVPELSSVSFMVPNVQSGLSHLLFSWLSAAHQPPRKCQLLEGQEQVWTHSSRHLFWE